MPYFCKTIWYLLQRQHCAIGGRRFANDEGDHFVGIWLEHAYPVAFRVGNETHCPMPGISIGSQELFHPTGDFIASWISSTAMTTDGNCAGQSGFWEKPPLMAPSFYHSVPSVSVVAAGHNRPSLPSFCISIQRPVTSRADWGLYGISKWTTDLFVLMLFLLQFSLSLVIFSRALRAAISNFSF
jgi:hypothetical protein